VKKKTKPTITLLYKYNCWLATLLFGLTFSPNFSLLVKIHRQKLTRLHWRQQSSLGKIIWRRMHLHREWYDICREHCLFWSWFNISNRYDNFCPFYKPLDDVKHYSLQYFSELVIPVSVTFWFFHHTPSILKYLLSFSLFLTKKR
jgi:hypothetical protein